MSTRRRSLLLQALLLSTVVVSARADDPLTFVPGPVFRIDTPRPGVQVAGKPLAAQARDAAGTLVAWLRAGQDGVAHTIWGRLVDSGVLSPERTLVRVPGKAIRDFSLSAGAHHYALAWSTFDPAAQRLELFARAFDLQLRPAGPAIRIQIDITEPPGKVWVTDGPQAGIDDSGRLVVAWLEEVDLFGLGRTDLSWWRARHYALNGQTETDITGGTSEGSRAMALAVAPGGSFVVAWEEYDPDVETRVEAVLFQADGASPPLSLNPADGGGFCRHTGKTPALAADANGFFLAFADPVGRTFQQGLNRVCEGVFGELFDPTGQILRGEFRIKRISWSPTVQSDGSRYLVVWEGFPPNPGGVRRQGAWAHPYFTNGFSAGPDLFIQQTPVTGMAFGPAGALVVWEEGGSVRARVLSGSLP
jgi:hypothetical protein